MIWTYLSFVGGKAFPYWWQSTPLPTRSIGAVTRSHTARSLASPFAWSVSFFLYCFPGYWHWSLFTIIVESVQTECVLPKRERIVLPYSRDLRVVKSELWFREKYAKLPKVARFFHSPLGPLNSRLPAIVLALAETYLSLPRSAALFVRAGSRWRW